MPRWQTPVAGWLEAFAEHPRIGDVAGLKAKFGAFAELSRDEQSAAAATADDGVYEVRCSGRRPHGGFRLRSGLEDLSAKVLQRNSAICKASVSDCYHPNRQ